MTKFHQPSPLLWLPCTSMLHHVGVRIGASVVRSGIAITWIMLSVILPILLRKTTKPIPLQALLARNGLTCRPAPFVGRKLQGDVKNTCAAERRVETLKTNM